MSRSWLAIVPAVLISLPASIRAERHRWAVVGIDNESTSAAETELQARGEIVIPVVTETESSRRRRADAAEQLARAFERASAHYLQDDYGNAIAEIETVEDSVLSVLLPTEHGRSLLVDLNLWLGALHTASSGTAGASDRFLLALSLDSAASLDAARWPPAYLEAFETARARTPPIGSLVITSNPLARFAIDGRPADEGRTVRIGAGLHYVLARRIGHIPVAQRTRVSAAGADTVKLSLHAAPDARLTDDADIAPTWYATEPRLAVRAIAAASGASRVLVVTPSGVTVFDAKGLQLSAAADVAGLWPADPAPPSPAPTDRSIAGRWWFWTAIGAVALAAGGATYWYATRDRDLVGTF